MRSVKNIFTKLPFFLKVILSIPWMIFWIFFAVIMAPFQIAYHASSAGKQSSSNFTRNHEDQNFKKAIALIELHNIRFGDYPENLQEENFREFLGEWDKFIYNAVTYSKLDGGYELNLNSQEFLQLEYPSAFWNGLGLIKTNVGGFHGSSLK
jgi:hypothetical protein